MKSDLGKFKEQLVNLTNYIDEIIPVNSPLKRDFEKINIKLKLGIDGNPRLLAELFSTKLYDFAHPILKGDDTFFMNYDYTKILEDNPFDEIEQKLKELWKQLNDEQKDRIRKYFKLLLILSCVTTKNVPLLAIINEYRETPLSF